MCKPKCDLAYFRDRFDWASSRIGDWVPADLRKGRVLDIGCGIGNGVAAAAAHGATISVGIDRSFSEFGEDYVREFPALCAAVGAPHSRTLMVEADIFTLRFEPNSFDYAMMIDSAEHVPNPVEFFKWAYQMLRPGGVLVVTTSPLYYSKIGHHLWPWFPAETDPWAHLRSDFLDRCAALGINNWNMDRFHELNRATYADLHTGLAEAGFTIVSEHAPSASAEDLELFAHHGAGIAIPDAGQETLFQSWIMVVVRK